MTMSDKFAVFSKKQDPEIDLSYLEKYGNRDTYHMPTFFEKHQFKKGQTFEARITYIYDPSKFWMVLKFRELEAFQIYLFRYYYKHRDYYKIPRDAVQVNLYCVAFTGGGYYRGVIVGCPVTTRHKREKVKVFFYDYGMMELVGVENLFYTCKKCVEVPQFAVRASLATVCPFNSRTWTSSDAQKFCELVVDKILVGNVVNVDFKRRMLEVFVCDSEESRAVPVHEALVIEKHAQYFKEADKVRLDDSSDEVGVKYLYLFPSHEVLESGKLPFSVAHAEFLMTFIPPRVLFEQYYKKSDTGRLT